MLLELTVNNIALIESLRVEFAQGFNVLTGETGSGKSIIVDCMNLVLGGRAERDLVRTGTDRGMVQALFDISHTPRARIMAEELGADCEGDLLVVSRELNRSGRNICRISGIIVPLATLRGLSQLLLDIHGQHEHQSLMDPAKHIDFLDSFGSETHRGLLKEAGELFEQRSSLSSDIRRQMQDLAEKERLSDMLSFQLGEISAAKLKRGEEERITSRIRILENAERIRSGLTEAYSGVYQGDGREASAQEALMRAYRAMQRISDIDTRYAEIGNRLKEAYDTVQDIGYEIGDLLEHVDGDPALLEKLSSRLELIDRLERKYGPKLEDVIAFGEKARTRLDEIQHGDDRIAEQKKELRRVDNRLREVCRALSDSRTALADRLSEEVMHQLSELGMGKTRFGVDIRPLAKPIHTGMDSVEFMISPNPGEPMKGLAAIASGGELSRIMLAMKAISMDVEGVESMVFDEIDTGVSGRMAQVVGEKMCSIARNRQVLCVTHLPQIAALGNAQYIVEKRTEDGRTNTFLRRLDAEGRIRELSRLVGGGEDSESSLSHAASMLEAAEIKRRQMQLR